MAHTTKLLAFAGSLRSESFNRKLIQVFADAAREHGAEVTLIDLHDYALPIYDGDIEAAGMPENVRKLQQLMADHAGLLIASPEYNGSMPALVKNTLDWISRAQADGSSGGALFKGKPVGIAAASPGAAGGLRGLIVLRDSLAKLGLWVAPSQLAVGKANDAFDQQGKLKDDNQRKALADIAKQVVHASQVL